MRAWQHGGDAREGLSQTVQTPRRPRFGEVFSPDIAPPRKSGPAESVKKPNLPGFFNSFADTGTPTKAPSQRARDKGKGKGRESIAVDDDERTFFAPPSPPSSPLGPVPMDTEDHQMEDLAPLPEPIQELAEAPTAAAFVIQDEDVKMDDEPAQAQLQDEPHEIEPPNWQDEVYSAHCPSDVSSPDLQLHRLLFVHVVPGKDIPTLQILLNSPVPPSAPADLQQTYTTSCAKIIEQFGLHSKADDWPAYVRVFSGALANLAWVLTSVGAVILFSVSNPNILADSVGRLGTCVRSSTFSACWGTRSHHSPKS